MIKFLFFLAACTLIGFGVTYERWSWLRTEVTITVKEKVELPGEDSSKEYYLVHEDGKYKADKDEYAKVNVGEKFMYYENNGWTYVLVTVGIIMIGIVLMSLGDGSAGFEFLAAAFEVLT